MNSKFTLAIVSKRLLIFIRLKVFLFFLKGKIYFLVIGLKSSWMFVMLHFGTVLPRRFPLFVCL